MNYTCSNGSVVSAPDMCVVISNESTSLKNQTIYTPSQEDVSQMQKAIFEAVNKKRVEFGIKTLIWSDAIKDVETAKSMDMAERDYFDHENPEGETFGDALKKDRIFYLSSAEDIFMLGNITSEKNLTDSAEIVVEGWLNSPSHRVPILDRDEIYSDAGVGIYCKKGICYFSMGFAEMETINNITLNNNYGTFYYLYNPTLPFDYDNVSLRLEVNSTKLTDTYIVEDKSYYNTLISGYPITSLSKFPHISFVNTTVIARKGYGVILYSDPDWVYSSANIVMKIRYLNQ
jgi:uncharacterized protein YkwD